MARTIQNTHDIRQIQMLMTLFLCIKPEGKLHVLFEHALRAPSGPTLARVTPISDVSNEGLKTWLESMFCHSNLSVAEKGAIDWQTEPLNMGEAIQELEEAQHKLGIKFTVENK